MTRDAVSGPDPVLTREVWEVLSTQRVFFGHQSVGANILDGVAELAADASASFRIVSAIDAQEPLAPGVLLEARIGENGDPASKLLHFHEFLDAGIGDAADVALMKFCYLDFGPQTDVPRVFDSYRREVQGLRDRYPHLILVHVTAPLTADEPTAKLWLKRLLGRTTQRTINAKRNQYNELIRSAYGGTEPVFDLARFESTRSDGSRRLSRLDGDTVYALAPDWTDDGGHLNEAGRRMAAAHLLSVLAAATGAAPTR